MKIIKVLQYDAKYVNINFSIKHCCHPPTATSHVSVNRSQVYVYYYYYYYSNDLLKFILIYVYIK